MASKPNQAKAAAESVGQRLDRRLKELLMAKSPVVESDRPEVRAPVLYNQGVQHVRMGEFREAVNAFSRAIFLAPGEPLPFVARGEAFAATCDFKGAVSNFRKALTLLRDPVVEEDVKIRLSHLIDAIGVAHLRNGEPKKAMRAFEEAIAEKSEKVFELHRCLALVAMNKLAEAEVALTGLLRVSDENTSPPSSGPSAGASPPDVASASPPALAASPTVNGDDAPDESQQAEAAEQVRRSADAVDAEARVMIVHIHLTRGDFARARQVLEASLARHYSHPRVQDMEARFDATFQRLRTASEEALDVVGLTRCITCFPDDAELYRSRALAYVAKKQYTNAVQDLFACLQKSGGSSPVASALMASTLATIADELAAVEDFVAAVNYYGESLKWASGAIEVYVARADCLVRLGKHEAALGDYKHALAMDPINVTVRHRLATLHDTWGMILYNQSKYDLAEVEFTRAITYDDENPMYPYHRALVRLMLKQQLLAVRDLVTCRLLRATDPVIQKLIQQFCPAESPRGQASVSLDSPSRTSHVTLIPVAGEEGKQQRPKPLAVRLGLPLQAAHLLRGVTGEQLQKMEITEGTVKELRDDRATLLEQTYAPALIRSAVTAPRTMALTKEGAVDASKRGRSAGPLKPPPKAVPARVWGSSKSITDQSRLDRVEVSPAQPVPAHLVEQRHRREMEQRDAELRAQFHLEAALNAHCQQHQSGVAPPPPPHVAKAKAARVRVKPVGGFTGPVGTAEEVALALHHKPAPLLEKPQPNTMMALPSGPQQANKKKATAAAPNR